MGVFSEEMVGLFDFLFVRRSFLGVRQNKKLKLFIII